MLYATRNRREPIFGHWPLSIKRWQLSFLYVPTRSFCPCRGREPQCRDREVRLIGADGEQKGVVSIQVAMRAAEDAGLDLVKIAPQAGPPACKVLDYKTDRRKTEADFLSAYRPQLNLYALAIDKRFAPKKVTYKGIYSLELGRLIEA